MNGITLGIGGLFAVISLFFGVYLVLAILRNMKAGQQYRDGMAIELSKLRLARMLSVHGIDPQGYLHTQPVSDIRKQMEKCAACDQLVQCDQLLESGQGETASFCANDDSLKAIGARVETL